MTDTSTIRDAVSTQRTRREEELAELVSLRSVSADPARAEDVLQTADRVVELLEAAGLQGLRLLHVPSGPPAVYGELRAANPDAPTILLYAHYDVQPPFDDARWSSDPFTAEVRDGRMFGRGAADDKHGVVSIAWAISALQEAGVEPAVHVKVLCEGEEEIGSPNLATLLETYGELLGADTFVIDDALNEAVGQPTLIATLRGLVDWEVTVRAMDGSGQHSGMFGGVVPDPRVALSQLIAGLVDERGVVTIPGIREGIDVPSLIAARLQEHPFDEAALRRTVKLLDDAPLGGDPDLHPDARVWLEPALTVIGIDGPDVANASNTIAPAARAKLSLRIGPGQDAHAIDELVQAHLTAQRPLGLSVEVAPGAQGQPFAIDEAHPSVAKALTALEEAFGVAPTVAGAGGSIPMIAPLQQANPDAGAILIGAGDSTSNIHGIDESLDLDAWERTTLAIALLLL